MNTIKTVVFDLGGVLVDLDIDRCTGAFRSLGMDAVADLINPYYPAEMIGRLEHGVISFHEACDEMRPPCRARRDNRRADRLGLRPISRAHPGRETPPDRRPARARNPDLRALEQQPRRR